MITPPGPSWLPQPRPIDPRFSGWLDCFRWLAALAVCSSHVRAAVLVDYDPAAAFAWLASPLYWLTSFGREAVIIFFVLSGYLVGGEVLREIQGGNFHWRVYATRRLARLYAVYLVALLLGALWDNVGLHFFNARQLYTMHDPRAPMLYYSVADHLNWPAFLGNLAFCQTLLVPHFGSNSPLWSLANEAWYYLLFPLAVWPLFSAGPRPARIACVILFLAAAWFVRGGILAYFSLWLLGLAPHFLNRPLLRAAWLPPVGVAIVLCLSRLHLLQFLPAYWANLLLALSFVLWLNTLAHRPARLPGSLAAHRYLAGFSYTLYLTHWPLTLLLTAILDQSFGWGYRMPFSLAAMALGFGLLGVVFFYGWALAQCTERHTAALRRWLLGLTGFKPTTRPPTAR